jgi:hypothetical protein
MELRWYTAMCLYRCVSGGTVGEVTDNPVLRQHVPFGWTSAIGDRNRDTALLILRTSCVPF